MARIKIDLPEKFSFSAKLDIRITDVNYGGHVGNDTILSYLQEARTKFFEQFGYTELNIEGVGTILSDVGIIYKAEIFYNDEIKIYAGASNFEKVSFELYYKIEKRTGDNEWRTAVIAKTGIVFFDYTSKKVAAIPEKAFDKLRS